MITNTTIRNKINDHKTKSCLSKISTVMVIKAWKNSVFKEFLPRASVEFYPYCVDFK